MNLATRAATPADLHCVLDADSKCFDDPWSKEMWQREQISVGVATANLTPVGFVAFEITDNVVRIEKIGIKVQFRQMGLSRRLVDDVVKCASFLGVPRIEMVIPESQCVPGTVMDITPWASKLGFRGVGIKANFRTFCGAPEDGFIFRLEIK